jgi:peptide/nickel transport system substrate-binding protein
MLRPLALAAAVAAALLAVSGASGVDAQTPKRGGTVVVAFTPAEPACLNVVIPRCGTGAAINSLLAVSQKVLERPFDVGPDFTWRPRLVSRVDFTRKRPFTLTYRIRPEARWSDGVPVRARDFLFTLRMIRAHGSEESREFHRVVRTIRAVDAKTVRVVLRPRFAGWRGLFGSILPSHALRGHDLTGVWGDRIDDPRTGQPIGSGPFLVSRLERGRQLTLVRNPRYWERRPHLDSLVVRFAVDGNTLVDSFRRGALHVALGFPPVFFLELRGQRELTTVSAPGVTWEHLAIRVDSGGHPALRDKRIRQALAYGIDRVAVARAAFGEIEPRLRPSDSAIYLLQSRHYRPNWSDYRYRPAEARRRLEQAGCRRGTTDGIYACAGRRLSVQIASTHVPGGFRERVIELVQTQLRQAGVEVMPLYVPQAVLFAPPGGLLPRGEFNLALFAWTPTGPDPGSSSIFACGRERNYMGYCQRLVSRDLDQADRILDPARQATVLNRADAQMAKDVPVIPLFQWPIWAAVTRDLRGFTPSPVNNGLGDAERWWLDG